MAGLVLPFLQGILFLVIGVLLLARESITVKRILVRLRQRYPAMAEKFTAASHKAHELLNRYRRRR